MTSSYPAILNTFWEYKNNILNLNNEFSFLSKNLCNYDILYSHILYLVGFKNFQWSSSFLILPTINGYMCLSLEYI